MREAQYNDGTLEEEQVAVSRARGLHWDTALKRSRSIQTSHWGLSTLVHDLKEEVYVSIAKCSRTWG